MNKILRLALIAIPILSVSIGLGAYLYIDNNSNSIHSINNKKIQIVDKKESNKFYPLDIFPELSTYEFYKYIRIEDANPIISKEMVENIVKNILKKINISGGNIKWGWNYDSIFKKSVHISFEWIPNDIQINPQTKTYNFSLIKSNI